MRRSRPAAPESSSSSAAAAAPSTTTVPLPEWDLLLSAAQKNDVTRIRELIERHHVPASHANAVGQSALHIACLWGNVQAVQTLVELGANGRAQNTLTGATPLHMATQAYGRLAQKSVPDAAQRVLQVVDCLLRAGADPGQPDAHGNLAADVLPSSSTTTNHSERLVLQELLDKLQPRPPVWLQAIRAGNLVAFRECLSSTTALEPFRGATPLSVVMKQLVELLPVHQDDDQDENNVVQQQAQTLHTMMQLLLQAGAHTPSTGSSDTTSSPLKDLFSLLQDLYKNTASTSSGGSAISWRIQFVQQTILDFIPYERNSADDSNNNDNNDDSTPWLPPDDWQLLQQAGRRSDQVPLLQFLIRDIHLNPNTKGRQGMTALQFAARSGNIPGLIYLLEQPTIDIFATDDRGKSALDAARVNNKQEAVRLLEEAIAAKTAGSTGGGD